MNKKLAYKEIDKMSLEQMKLRVKEFYPKINSDELDKHELIRILRGKKYWVSYYHNDIENRASLINTRRIGTIILTLGIIFLLLTWLTAIAISNM